MAVVESDLSQRGRGGSTEPVAFDSVAAVTCYAMEVSIGVGTASAAPDPA